MQEKTAHSYMPLIICSIASFITPFMGSAVNIALPVIGDGLKANAVILGWVAMSYNLAAAMFLLPLGRLADLKGREILFRIGLGVFGLCSLGCALAWDPYSLVVFRFFQGLGGALLFGTSNAILSAYYPKEVRGKMLGICVSALYLGMALGPTIGGFMTSAFGWRALFGFVTLLTLVAALLAVFRMRNLPVDVPGKLDLSGSIVYCVALTLIMFGFSSLPAFTGVIYMVLGIAGFFAFGLIELKVKSPILDIRIFRGNYPFIFSNLAELIAYSATFALGFLLSIYLQCIKGMSPGEAGLTMVIQTVLMVLLSKSTGSLSDKVDPAIIAAGGMAVTAVGLGTFIFLTPETPVWWIIVCMGIVGVGLSFFISPITNAVMSSVEKKDFGLASATLGSMRTLGMNFSMGIILMLFTINHVQKIGRSIPKESFEAFLKTTKVGFTIFAVLCLFAILSLIIRGRVRERAAPESGMPESGQKEAAGL